MTKKMGRRGAVGKQEIVVLTALAPLSHISVPFMSLRHSSGNAILHDA